jgi:biopolymer transport protein ExbD
MAMNLRRSFMRERAFRKVHKRDVVPLNLVSMIDIFTTLVFFLLLTSTSVQTLRAPRSLTLPDSLTMDVPADAPVLMITPEDILLQGEVVMKVADAESQTGEVLEPLKAALLAVPITSLAINPPSADGTTPASPTPPPAPGQPLTTRGEVNIMADKDIPYLLLKKVMRTAGEAQFARIALTVNHKSGTLPGAPAVAAGSAAP